jgi:AraC-like DNA-binding protein
MSQIQSISVPATYLAVFLDDLAPDEPTRRAIHDKIGLTADQTIETPSLLSLEQMLATLRFMDSRLRPGWHIAPTLRLQAAHHGPLGIAVVTAATVAKALDSLVRFEPTRAPWTMIRSEDSGADRVLTVLPATTLPPAGDLLMEINLLALTALINQLVGRRQNLAALTLPERYRAWEQALYSAMPGQVTIAGSHHLLTVPADQLHKPCLLADPALHANAVAQCQTLLFRTGGPSPLCARIRQQLLAASDHFPDLETIAAQLHISPRTLIRQLSEQDTSYRQLVDEVRLTLANDLLWHTDMSIAVIAERLGYADPANFSRAFRRWTGTSPGQVRRRGPDLLLR